MKRLSLLVLLIGVLMSALPSYAQEIPDAPANGWFILDQLDWFTSAQETTFNQIAKDLRDGGFGEIGVATIDDCGDDHARFRNDLFRHWGIGNPEVNNGLLILVCWQGGGSTRSLEQATGYGTEGMIPDILAHQVAEQHFVAAFRALDEQGERVKAEDVISNGTAAEAILNMVRYYDTLYRGGTGAISSAVAPLLAPPPPTQIIEGIPNWLFWVIVVIVLILAILVLASSSSGGGSSGGGYWSSGSSGGSSSSSNSSSSNSGGGYSGGSSGGGGSSNSF